MNEIIAPNMAIGALLLAAAVFYAAWHEYSEKNHRDAKVLAAVGAASLISGAVSWL
jgi:H+/Cl- antiporter ClcA